MSYKKSLLIAAATTLVLLGSLSAFNFHVDPMCYYHCADIDPHKKTTNHFYELGQIIVTHPNTEVILLGSSRAQTTPPLWIQKILDQSTLNLGMGGADLYSKLAALNMALDHTRVNKVLWFADYFEFTPEITDITIRTTPAIRKYLDEDPLVKGAVAWKSPWLEIFDHNTLEAALYSLKKTPPDLQNQGSGSYLDYDLCEGPRYKGEKTPIDLQKEKDSAFEHYTRQILNSPQSEKEWEVFGKEMWRLSAKSIETRIVLTPYNPTFYKRLEAEFPEQFERHQAWRKRLGALKIPHVQVFDFFGGIPGDDESNKFWNDGVHFTCRGAMKFLTPVLKTF